MSINTILLIKMEILHFFDAFFYNPAICYIAINRCMNVI